MKHSQKIQIFTSYDKSLKEKKIYKIRQVINKLVRGAEMTKDEAKKAVEALKTPEEKIKRGNRTERDYAAMMLKTYRPKKVEAETLTTPETPAVPIKKLESKPRNKK